MMKTTGSRLRACMRAMREVGYAGLAEDERAVLDAFDAGNLWLVDDGPRVFGEPADEEFVPRDHNDADGVQTMRDFG